MIITSVPWAWGFADGARGESVYTGYCLFVGPQLAEYQRGWAAGKEATSTYVPFQGSYKDVLPDYQREDWVGA